MKKGFTLIELLIVVAIIAILAAIAVPNFLEAQTRAKVSRALADIRTVATALETYQIDNNRYPPDGQANEPTPDGAAKLPRNLSTPISYLTTSYLVDEFKKKGANNWDRQYRYVNFDVTYKKRVPSIWASQYEPYAGNSSWLFASNAPDQEASVRGSKSNPGSAPPGYWIVQVYDATNGTVSGGDVFKTNAYTNSWAKAF